MDLIHEADDVHEWIRKIADQNVESDNEDGDDGEAEVVALARRSLQLFGGDDEQTLVEG